MCRARPKHPRAVLALPPRPFRLPLPILPLLSRPKIPPGGAWGCPPFWVSPFFPCWVFFYFKSNLARKREVSSPGVPRSTHLPSCRGAGAETAHFRRGMEISATRAQGRTALGKTIFPGVFEHLETQSCCCSQRAAAITLKGVSPSICCGTTRRGAAPFAARGCSCLETCSEEQPRRAELSPFACRVFPSFPGVDVGRCWARV